MGKAAAELKAPLINPDVTWEQIQGAIAAEKAAAETVKRREVQASAKIKAAEAAMVKELQERAANLAIATATEIITSKLDEKASLELVDTAVSEIEKLN